MADASPAAVATANPTRVRYTVLGFSCALSMITYLDRACFGVAAKGYLVPALGLNSIDDLTLALSAFNLSYAAFEIPSGWLGDVFGPRKTLIRIVLWWSFFTMLSGLAGLAVAGTVLVNFAALVVVRFLFGMGEAGAYPNITRALHNWFPLTERGWAQGVVWMSGRLMGGLTPLLWWALVESGHLSWRTAFALFGVLGVGWCLAFAASFRNRPEEKPEVNPAEQALITAGRHGDEGGHAGVPWLKLLADGNLWALCLMYACTSYGWYFNLNYLHAFLEEQHGVDPKSPLGAVFKGGPLWMGAAGCFLGGWLTDWFIRRTGDRKWGRRLFGVTGHGLCALLWVAALFVQPNQAFLFFLAVSLAAFCNDVTMGASWATCQDIGRRYAAIVAGAMNTVGNLGGFAAVYATGLILGRYKTAYALAQGLDPQALTKDALREALLPGYHLNFMIYAAVYAVAVLLWLRVDATKPVAQE
jgi:MFS family permease